MLKNLFKIILAAVLVGMPLASISQALMLVSRHGNFGEHTYTYRRYVRLADQTQVETESSPQVQSAISKVAPAVVDIYGYRDSAYDPSGTNTVIVPLYGGTITITPQYERRIQIDAGTGFFIDKDGYILTANHVVLDRDAHYMVQLSDGRQADAQVVLRNPTDDVAILKIDGSDYPVVNLGDSSQLQDGQTIIGIGNALGKVHNLPAVGTIEPMADNLVMTGDAAGGQQLPAHLFQSSMQLYPGHSGGPTFDLSGNVVGINDAIAADQPNISFSIPINDAKDAIKQATQNENALLPEQY